jgi:cell surface protein SprA
MLLTRNLFFACCICCTMLGLSSWVNNTPVHYTEPTDLPKLAIDSPPTLRYPIKDNRGDGLSGNNKGTFYLPSANNKDSVVYDAKTKTYTVYEKIGNKYYRTPTTYSFNEFWALRNKQAESDYFKKRANTTNLLNRGKLNKPKLSLSDNLFNRLFGSGKIDITPNGSVDIIAGYQGQKINNPTLPERARRSGGLDFNLNAQLNMNANIGDKLKFPINYNTQANFNLDNQIKLDFTGKKDDILKRFEAGTVNFTSKGTLIPGVQQLFGLKTQLQFGKLFVTTILANQKSQRQTANFQGNSSAQNFEIKGEEYEENRHFLLAQYFRDNYNNTMKNAPAINTPVQILKLQVWVTNRNGITTETRDVVGFMDMAERNPFSPAFTQTSTLAIPTNGSNDLLTKVRSLPDARNPAAIFNNLTNILNLSPVQDFEKFYARKLDNQSFVYNKQLGTISLASPLQTDEVLGVAYQYSFNGKIYQVGEFSEDLPPDSTSSAQKILYLKLLKATSQRVTLPIWDLMMKNVYSVGYGNLSREDFKLDVLYEQPGLGAKRYLPFGDKNQGAPIISLINLDRLNNQNDPQPDGVFDYIDSFTVNSQYSRVMFPVLEPFGRDIAPQIYNNPVASNAGDTLFYALYDSIKAVAVQYPNLNRFTLRGSARTSGGSGEQSLGFNIPRGSVTVTAGGRVLQEGVDYEINYDLGTLKVTNPAITTSGLPVQVSFENNATFGLQQRAFRGIRLDYQAKNTASTQLSLGATAVRLSERPFFTKVNLGDDPIKNSMYGLDANYKKDLPKLTKILDKLPFYTPAQGAQSNMNAYVEAAMLKPGHAPQIGRGNNGVIYIDDFEGSKSGIDLRFPATAWTLASTPRLFPEATLSNDLNYGKNRAKLAWYQIEQVLQQPRANTNPIADANIISDPRVRPVYQKEIFPQRTTGFGESQLQTFDLAFYPKERGPYNFDLAVDAQGNLTNPRARWGGLMRNIDQTDFETANIEFIETWIQDPFINKPGSIGGKLYFNLGNISEDILNDGRRMYENGISTPNAPAPIANTIWGSVPSNPIQVTNAFSNNPDDRQYQDIGLDGTIDSTERRLRQTYLNALSSTLGAGSPALAAAQNDPSSDNFVNYRSTTFSATDGILKRYKNFNGTEGNSPVAQTNPDPNNPLTAATFYPDAEDVVKDNNMQQIDEYFEYRVDLVPNMQVGTGYIVDKKTPTVTLPNGSTRVETWYQLRIPVTTFTSKVGNIPDFKSIRFIRMYMTDFDDTTVIRFGQLQLARNIWRRNKFQVDYSGTQNIATNTPFNIGAVNIEENDTRLPLPYRTPRDIQRQQTVNNQGVNLLANEQSITLQFANLKRGDTKSAFQTFSNKDLRQFKKLSMYVHSEKTNAVTNNLKDKDLTAIFRLGTDFINNYYEVRIPLINTKLDAATKLGVDSEAYNDSLWNPANSLDLDLELLTRIKQDRNLSSTPVNVIFSQLQANGHNYSVMGNPNLGEIKGMLIGVENTNSVSPATAEIWANELRLSSLDEKGGYAALARIDFTLADLGTLSLSGNMHTQGFGTLEQRVNERTRDNFYQFDVAANLDLGKLTPKKAALSIPVFASYSQSVSSPEYDPYDLDIKLKDKVKAAPTAQKDSIRKTAVDFTSIKTVNFTNVRKNRTGNKKPKIYDVENLDFSYSYLKTSKYSPLIEYNDVTRHRGVVGYSFTPTPKYITPLKFLFKKSKTKWFDILKDFNFNLIPSQLTFRGDIQRQFGVIKPRSLGGDKYQTPETYDKYLIFQRDYVLNWKFTRNLALDFTATNNSRVDEPAGRIDTRAKKDSLWQNLLRGGRNTLYNQNAAFSYTVPINKIPLLDFVTQTSIKYQATYRWIGASRIATNLGNFLENGTQKEATTQLDFTRLYAKSKFLRQLDVPSNKADKERWRNRYTKITDSVTNKAGKRVLRTRKILDKSAMPYVGGPLKVLGKLVTSLKDINVTISENAQTRLPGYTDSTQAIGQNFRSMAPGLDFVFGRQVDSNWLNRKAAKGLITKDVDFNYLFKQNFDQTIQATARIEPIRDLTITVNIKKTFSKDYSETFKYADTTGGTNYKFQHLTPYSTGGFDISYIAFKTLFGKFDPNVVSETFKTFVSNTKIMSGRLGTQNPYTQATTNQGLLADGYYYGYGKYSVDVLIPSFIAAYTGQSPESVSLIKQSDSRTRSNPFKGVLPKPNWQLNYNGLTRVKGLDKIFTNFNVSHGYNGSLSMNGFTSALLYQDVSRFGYPSFYDTLSKSYVPFFLVPNISIQEQFSPLIGFDMAFTNQLQAKFEYAKSRTLSLSLFDYQLSEQRSTSYNITAGYRKKGLKLLGGLRLPKFLGGGKALANEIAFRFEYGIRDNVTSNTSILLETNFATGGSKEITLRPSIDYTLNNRINLKFYFDQTKIKPYISSSAPTTNTRAGVQVHISLSQ